jgi:predicted ArsR family transcriptional regulator
MNGEDTNSVGDQRSIIGDRADDPLSSIRSLVAENEASVRRLRAVQIPQHVGMAAACRALAVELPRALAAQVDADLSSGVLAQRWEAVRTAAAEAGASGEADPTVAALALLLREQGRAAMRHLVRREKEWAADAYRLEGQADALDAQVHQLRRVVSTAPATDAGETTLNAEPLVVAELDAHATTEPPGGAR